MQDDEIMMANTCADLLSLKKMEAFPLHLFKSKQPGEWIGIREFCLRIGVVPGDLRPEVFATWLPDPMAHDGYAVILFYDHDSGWSMAAHFHRALLLGDGSPSQSLQPIQTAPMPAHAAPTPTAAPAEL